MRQSHDVADMTGLVLEGNRTMIHVSAQAAGQMCINRAQSQDNAPTAHQFRTKKVGRKWWTPWKLSIIVCGPVGFCQFNSHASLNTVQATKSTRNLKDAQSIWTIVKQLNKFWPNRKSTVSERQKLQSGPLLSWYKGLDLHYTFFQNNHPAREQVCIKTVNHFGDSCTALPIIVRKTAGRNPAIKR